MIGLLIIEIFFIVVLLAIAIQSIKKNKFMLFLFSIFTAFYLILRPILLLTENYYSFAILNPQINNYSEEALLYEFFYVFSMYIVVYFSYKYFMNKKIKIRCTQNNKYDIPKKIMSLVSIAVIAINPIMGLPYLTYQFIFLYLKKQKITILILIFFFALIFFFTFSIDRRDWLFLLLTILFMLFALKKKKNILKVLFSGVFSIIILGYILLAFRTEGLFNYNAVYDRILNTSQIILMIEIETDFSIVTDDVIILFDELLVKDNIDYLYGINFFKPFFSLIPRTIWEDKPLTISALFSKKFNYDFYLHGGSEPITIYGELMWNFGLFSVLIFLGAAYIFSYLDKVTALALKCKDYNILAKTIVYTALTFHLLRGPIDSFWLVFLAFYLLLIFENVLRNIYRKRS